MIKDWFSLWQEFMRPEVQACIVDRRKSHYMRLAIFLRAVKLHNEERRS